VDWITAGQVSIPPGSLKGSYIILLAMGLFNLAIGCLASSLTSNQIIAAVISFTVSLLHFLGGLFIMVLGRKVNETFVDIINYFASMEHIRTFSSGLIDTRPLVYYTSLSLLFLALTHQVLEFRRWKP
jgi:ABC-2 type transport system permease protein